MSGVVHKWGYFLIPEILSVIADAWHLWVEVLLSIKTSSLKITLSCFLRSVLCLLFPLQPFVCGWLLFPCRSARRNLPLYEWVTANFYCIFSDETGNKVFTETGTSPGLPSSICNTPLSAVIIIGPFSISVLDYCFFNIAQMFLKKVTAEQDKATLRLELFSQSDF